jgi:two-component system cell cycle sensor histidine kinase/response regulator CckA
MFYTRTGVPVKPDRLLPIHLLVTMVLQEPACLEQDETFDRLARLVAKAVQSSAAFVSLADVDADEIVFAGITGLPEIQAGERKTLSQTICRHVVSSGSPLVVADTQTHPLARNEPAILELGLGAYLGVPLTTAEGKVVGVLCTVDRHAREWSPAQIEIAEGLAAAVMTEIGLRTSMASAARQAEERAAILESLRAADLRFRSLIENIPLVTYMNGVEESFTSIYMSPQVESLLGYTPEEWAERPELAQEGIHPDDRKRVDALAREARKLGIPTRSEFRFVARDGRVVWVLDQTIPVRDEDGTIVCHQGFLLDITEQKLLEEQLRQSQKMEAIGQLAGGIAHDFNNMLTAISGYAELLAHSFDEGDPRSEDVDQVRKAAAHAAALTRQLLTFSRKQVLLPQRLDVNDVVRDLEAMLARTIGAEVELKTSFEDALPLVETDPDQLAQVVVNMAINGRDAMPTGGVLTITTKTVDSELGSFVVVEIADTGTGMDEETRTRAFEPFFTTKDTGKGTGLGLATAYGVVSQSGGRIEIETTLGEGSTFRVLLPAAA